MDEYLQCTETGSSGRAELEGLKRSLDTLRANGCVVSVLVTDRHPQIKCFMKRSHGDIKHVFDCWHVAKAIKKKLLAAGKFRGYEQLARWAQSVSNHLYWCASSSEGNDSEIVPKWVSLCNHVINIHLHDSEAFPECLHGNLENENKDWILEGECRCPLFQCSSNSVLQHFSIGSDVHRKLKEIVAAPMLLRDIGQLSTSGQTYSSEAFHSQVNHFAPKQFQYGYHGMEARYVVQQHLVLYSGSRSFSNLFGVPTSSSAML